MFSPASEQDYDHIEVQLCKPLQLLWSCEINHCQKVTENSSHCSIAKGQFAQKRYPAYVYEDNMER